MAGASIIGALRVVLGADTAAFEDGLKGAESRLSAFGSSIAKGAAVVGAAVAAMGVAIGVAVKHSLDEADKLGKMSQSIGVPVEELSRLKHAADLSGVGLEDLGKSVGRLSKAMSEVAGGATGPATQAFRALGVQVQNTDGTLKTSTQVMSDLAGKFSGIEDGAGKTALAMAIFGKAGAEMIPLLNQGAAGLREAAQEADALGIVIDTKTAKAAEEFNDNLTRLGKVKDGIITKITAGMAPALAQMSAALVQAAKDSDLMKSVSETLTSVLKFSTGVGITFVTVIQRISAEVSALVQAVKLLAAGEFSKALATFRAAGDETAVKMTALQDKLRTLWDAPAQEIADKAPDTAAKIAAPILQSSDTLSRAIADVGTAAGQMLNVVGGHMNKFVAEGERARASVASVGQKIAEETARADALRAADELSADQHAKKIALINEKYKNDWASVTDSVGGSLASIANTFGRENEKMAVFAKAAAIVQATVAVYQAAASALANAGIFPLNIAASAAVLAKGVALIGTIKGQSLPKFQTGGSFIVPGGIGGGDRVMFPILAEPGEQVDVWRPGDPGADPRRGSTVGGDRTLTIKFEGDDFGIGQKLARKIAVALNEAVRDGTRLKFA